MSTKLDFNDFMDPTMYSYIIQFMQNRNTNTKSHKQSKVRFDMIYKLD